MSGGRQGVRGPYPGKPHAFQSNAKAAQGKRKQASCRSRPAVSHCAFGRRCGFFFRVQADHRASSSPENLRVLRATASRITPSGPQISTDRLARVTAV